MPNNDRSNQPTIAVVGVSSVDITIREAPDWMGHSAHDVYTPESLHTLNSPVEMGLGGNGAAAAYVLGKLGIPVELSTSIGTDAPGQLARGWLKQAGVRCLATKPAASTMVALSAVDGQGKRKGCLQHPGTELEWSLSASDTGATWLLVMIHSQVTPDELPAVHHLMQQFRKAGRTTVVDTGMGWIINRAEPQQIHALWSGANIVTGTSDELAHWTACSDPESIASRVLSHGAQQVVIKMGADGAAYQSDVQAYTHEQAVPVGQANRSIGAGDAFTGAMVGALAVGESLAVAVNHAQQIAAKVVQSGRCVLGWRDSCSLTCEEGSASPTMFADGFQSEDPS